MPGPGSGIQLKAQLRSDKGEEESQLKILTRELKDIERGTEPLYEAVEKGLLPMDSTLQERAHKLKVRRETILRELASVRRAKEMPSSLLNPSRIQAFCRALKARLLDRNKGFAKQYLRLLVSEIRLTGKEVRLQGSHAALAHAMGETGTLTGGVPSFVPSWLPE